MSTLTGGRHVEFVWQRFPKTFEKIALQKLQNGDLQQVSCLAKLAMQEIGCTIF